jgi:hypothetical protein
MAAKNIDFVVGGFHSKTGDFSRKSYNHRLDISNQFEILNTNLYSRINEFQFKYGSDRSQIGHDTEHKVIDQLLELVLYGLG